MDQKTRWNTRVNAFATLNGQIFVYSGLVEFVSGPEELASILAHEIGHHENGDLIDRLVKELGLNVLMAILTGGDAVMTSFIIKPCENCGSGNFVELDKPGSVPIPQSSIREYLVRIFTCNPPQKSRPWFCKGIQPASLRLATERR